MHGVIGAIHRRVVAGQQHARSRVLRHLAQLRLEHLHPLLPRVVDILSERTERVHVRDIDVVVVARMRDGLLRHVDDFLIAAGRKQRAAEEVVRALGVRLLGDRPPRTPLRLFVLLLHVQDPRFGHQHLGIVPSQRAGALAGRRRAFDPLRIALEQVVILRARVRDRGVRQRELRIERHRILEHLQRELEILPRQPPRVTASAQIEVVGLQVLGRLDRQRLLLLRRQRDPERLGDPARDLVLHLEHILHLPVVTLGPQREIGMRVDELRIDAKPRSGATQASRQYVSGVELLTDRRRRHCLVAISEDRSARENLQPLDLRKLGDNVFSDAVAQILILFDAAQVFEIEHGDRLQRRRRFARFTRVRATPAARIDIALEAQQIGLLMGRSRIVVEDVVEDDGRGVALERKRRGSHLIEDGAEGEDVGAGVGELSAGLLRRHVRNGADRRAGFREVLAHRGRPFRLTCCAGSALDLRQTEVEDLGLAAGVDEDVRRLDVTVNDSLRVRRLERVRELNADIEQASDVERAAADPLRERDPFQQFHGDEVLPLELIDRVDSADRRMVERRRGACFALKTVQGGPIARQRFR